jgi:hypothetical protein
VIPIDRTDTPERLARIEQMIEKYRATKERQLLRRAIKLCRKTEAHQRLAEFEAPPERVH